MAALARADQSALGHEIGEVARRGCGRCPGDADIFAGAQPALESLRIFAQHPEQRFLLTVVELIAQAVEQAGLVDQELDERYCAPLRFDGRCREPGEPWRDIVDLVVRLQRVVNRPSAWQEWWPPRSSASDSAGFGRALSRRLRDRSGHCRPRKDSSPVSTVAFMPLSRGAASAAF